MRILNESPYAVAQTVLLDEDGAETLIVAVGASYDIAGGGGLSVAEKQPPLTLVDTFHGEPDASSIRQDAELGPARPATDVFLCGSATAKGGPAHRVDVTFRVGGLVQRAAVFGRRFWKNRLGTSSISEPEPFERIPLTWEKAFGGADITPRKEKHHGHEARNPVGCGYFAKRTRADWKQTELPQVENPNDLLRRIGQKVEPVGFLPVARHWRPRSDYVGTYDDQWQRERVPLLPEDFDRRFHNAAPAELVAAGRLTGSEAVEISGCTPGGRLAFELPRLSAMATIDLPGESDEIELPLESVRVDTEAMTLRLVYKGTKRVHGRALALRRTEIRITEVGP
jgi:hypothetical protein